MLPLLTLTVCSLRSAGAYVALDHPPKMEPSALGVLLGVLITIASLPAFFVARVGIEVAAWCFPEGA